jgi:hypothetical protein
MYLLGDFRVCGATTLILLQHVAACRAGAKELVARGLHRYVAPLVYLQWTRDSDAAMEGEISCRILQFLCEFQESAEAVVVDGIVSGLLPLISDIQSGLAGSYVALRWCPPPFAHGRPSVAGTSRWTCDWPSRVLAREP